MSIEPSTPYEVDGAKIIFWVLLPLALSATAVLILLRHTPAWEDEGMGSSGSVMNWFIPNLVFFIILGLCQWLAYAFVGYGVVGPTGAKFVWLSSAILNGAAVLNNAFWLFYGSRQGGKEWVYTAIPVPICLIVLFISIDAFKKAAKIDLRSATASRAQTVP